MVKTEKSATPSSEISFLTKPVSDPELAVVFIHGFPFNKGMWVEQLNHLPDSVKGIAYDIRGFGLSTTLHHFFTIDLFASDLIDFIQHIGLKKVVACGLSMGGYIALRAFEQRPDLFEALILCDTNSSADTNQAKLNRFKSIEQILNGEKNDFADDFLKKVLSSSTLNENHVVTDMVRNMILSVSDSTICSTQLALASRTDTTALLPQINVPSLIIRGNEDMLMLEEQALFLQAQIKNSELCQIPNSAHLPNLENSCEFNKSLNSFLQRLLG